MVTEHENSRDITSRKRKDRKEQQNRMDEWYDGKLWQEDGNHVLPTHIARIIRLNPQLPLAANLAKTVSAKLVAFVRLRGEPHRADVVWARVGGDSMRAGLPDAGGEVETRLWVGDAIPVHDKLRRQY